MDYHELVKNAVDNCNAKLATITTFTELQELKKEMDNYGFGLVFIMTTKKGGNENGIFKVDEYTVEYITTATSKTYRCKIKNLHKVMCVHY